MKFHDIHIYLVLKCYRKAEASGFPSYTLPSGAKVDTPTTWKVELIKSEVADLQAVIKSLDKNGETS